MIHMENNELNDLFDYGYKIFQNPNYFKFSVDSVLLGEFVNLRANDKKVLDLCSGNGSIPMILSSKYGSKIEITGVELQETIYDMAIESIKYNNITNINMLNKDVNELCSVLPLHSFDVVTVNPPYFKVYDNSFKNKDDIKSIARHEIKTNLENIISISSNMLKNGGYLYMVHRPERLSDIIIELENNKFGLKRLVPIYNDDESKCVFILIEAIYNGKSYVNIDKPVVLNHNLKTYKNIFGGNL